MKEELPVHQPVEGNMVERTAQKVEQQANYEGNDTLLLFERLHHPVIREQIISLMERAYEARAASGRQVVREVLDTDGQPARQADGALILEEVSYVPPTREEIEAMLDARLAEVALPIDTDEGTEPPTSSRMSMNWEMPWSGLKPNTKQWSIFEAHEKGHKVRFYSGERELREFFQKLFNEGFDAGAVEYKREDFEQDMKHLDEGTSFERARELAREYCSDPMELVERMAQLKNYFGLTGDEEFTKEHLSYARAHYIEDTGVDNHMTHFFQGITPEKEEGFLRLINSVGV